MRRFRHILPLILLCLPMGLSLSFAGETPTPQTPPVETDRKPGEVMPAAASGEVLRFTNADLPSLTHADRGAGREQEKAAGKDGTRKQKAEADGTLAEALQDASNDAIRKSIGEARREIAILELRLEALNSRLLSIQNPLLAGVNPPSREEEEAVGGAPNTVRLAWVKEQIAATEEALVAARERFQTLFRR